MDLTTSHELDGIFSNITDIAELTITLIGSLEDTLEMAEDGQVGFIRSYLISILYHHIITTLFKSTDQLLYLAHCIWSIWFSPQITIIIAIFIFCCQNCHHDHRIV